MTIGSQNLELSSKVQACIGDTMEFTMHYVHISSEVSILTFDRVLPTGFGFFSTLVHVPVLTHEWAYIVPTQHGLHQWESLQKS